MSLSSFLEPDRHWMKLALREAERGYEEKEVPVGAVVVRDGVVLGKGHNMVEQLKDPTAHAEMIAITAACSAAAEKRLDGCTLYVTLEPCPMCAGAIVWSRLSRLVFGPFDEKAGSCSTLYNIPRDRRLNHVVEVVSGVLAEESAQLLRNFFAEKRS
ncbi:MAG TPA: tRNA adenosine(34) deaminase TadA [Rhodothermales bacterium]|nr:tRNA adenosine(34) deaminase TadA [Rhodothermales bacterium]